MEIEQESYRPISIDFAIGVLIKNLWKLSRPISIDFCIGVLIKKPMENEQGRYRPISIDVSIGVLITIIWKLSRRATDQLPFSFLLEVLLKTYGK